MDKIFAEVRREDHRRRVMLGDIGSVQMDASALAVRTRNYDESMISFETRKI